MIPPHELKNKEFTRVMRGYSIPEVDEYISFVMEKYTDLYRENDALERKLQSVLDTLDTMRAEEESVRTALINAQKAGKKIVADASDRADKIMRSTKSDCMRVLAEFRDKAAEERRTLTELKTAVASLKQELYEKYQTHIAYIEELTPNADMEAAAMRLSDSDEYAQKISDGIVELVREDFDFDLSEEKEARPAQKGKNDADTAEFTKDRDTQTANETTLVFDKVVTEPPRVQHVSITRDGVDTDAPAPAEALEDADALLEAIAAEMGARFFSTDEDADADEPATDTSNA